MKIDIDQRDQQVMIAGLRALIESDISDDWPDGYPGEDEIESLIDMLIEAVEVERDSPGADEPSRPLNFGPIYGGLSEACWKQKGRPPAARLYKGEKGE